MSGGSEPPPLIIQNAIQGQWVLPNVIETSGAIYAGYATRTGGFGVARLVGSTVTRSTLATREADDHNVPALVQTVSGQILAVYSRHAAVATIYSRLSASADAMDWGTERTVSTSSAATYAQLHRLAGEARVWLLYRVGSSEEGSWAIRYTDDDGTTWSTERILCPNTYVASFPDPLVARIRCYAYDHPVNGSDHDVYYFDVDLETGDVENMAGQLLGNADTGVGLPLLKSEEDKVVDVAGSTTTRLYEGGRVGEPALLASEFIDSTGGTYYRYTYDGAGALFERQAIATSGPAFFDPSYFGGCCFAEDDLDVVYCARNLGASIGLGSWELVRYETVDGGANWTRAAVIRTTSNIIARPQARAGRIWWSEASNYEDFGDFTAALCSVAT